MTTYSTRAIAEKLIGADAVEANAKAATRTVRKFLRADAVAAGGAVGVDTPGKGGRYALELKAAEVKAMAKRFAAWEIAEEKAKAERAALKEAQAKASTPLAPACEDDPSTDEEIDDDSTDEATGPSDEEIAAMLSDDEDETDI